MKEADCGFIRDNKWFRYRAAAIIVENGCVLFAGVFSVSKRIRKPPIMG